VFQDSYAAFVSKVAQQRACAFAKTRSIQKLTTPHLQRLYVALFISIKKKNTNDMPWVVWVGFI